MTDEQVTDLHYMFPEDTSFTGENSSMNSRDISNVEDMLGTSYEATTFNKDIGYRDTPNGINMNAMFIDARSSYQDLSRWDVSKVKYESLFCNGTPICDNPRLFT